MNAVVVKVGGSLALYPEKLRGLCAKLSELSKVHMLLLVPGGGIFADTVRNLDKRFNLSSVTAHRMAILGMDQYGLMLLDLCPNSQLITNLKSLGESSQIGKLHVLLPSAFVYHESALESSWDLTSDSIAAFIAWKLHVTRLILVTDVDGVFDCDPKKFPEAKLIRRLPAAELLRTNERTAVDRFLPKLLLKTAIDCFVVNGFYPERIEAILNETDTVCTVIAH